MAYTWFDDYLLGQCVEAYHYLGAHFITKDSIPGVQFTLYAPGAKEITVIGDFNHWDYYAPKMTKIDSRGLWEIFIPHVTEYSSYKYHILNAQNAWVDKADPVAFFSELRPLSSSRVFDIENFVYHDEEFMNARTRNFDKAVSIYEVHLGSWLGKIDGRFYSYEEIAPKLIDYCRNLGYTHIEIMPITQYPFDGSWGYQVTGYFSVDSRYGNPKQLMSFIDQMHQANIGVILDFVPVHFAIDEFSLRHFDGTNMYEYSGARELSQWGTCNFDLGKDPVRSFLMSSVDYFLNYFHFDGVRMDAVSNLIYIDGDTPKGENPGALEFIKRLNYKMHALFPSAMLIAEDSSAFNGVTRDIDKGGLGFDYKWDLGWMNDTLKYYQKDPIYRKYHHSSLTFSMCYFFNENFVLPLSHDEVVYGKGTIVNKMWGDYDTKFAEVRNLYVYQMAHPGKKLNFMGNELASFDEWNENKSLPWELKSFPKHDSITRLIRDLNLIYTYHKAMHFEEYNPAHFQWLMCDNADQSILAFKRQVDDEVLIFVFNMTPNYYEYYDVGIPYLGVYEELFNSDKDVYAGNNQYNGLPLQAYEGRRQSQPYHITLKLASYGALIFRLVNENNPQYSSETEKVKLVVTPTSKTPASKSRATSKKKESKIKID